VTDCIKKIKTSANGKLQPTCESQGGTSEKIKIETEANGVIFVKKVPAKVSANTV
jgi:hypothetical protein